MQNAVVFYCYPSVSMSYPVADISQPNTDTKTAQAARRLETFVRVFATLFAIVIAFISFGYCFLIYPQTDDLERTGALRVFSMLQRIKSDCMGIEGRWAADLLEYPAYFGGHIVHRYPTLLIALMVIGIAACCCVVSLVMGRRISERSVLASGIVAYAILWLGPPFGEQFYWYPASIEEWLILAIGMVLLWLMSNFTAPWAKAVVVFLAFVMPGVHEVFGGWIIGVLAAVWLVKLVTKKKAGTVAAATVASILGAASNLLMPGVRGRASGSAHESWHDAMKQVVHIEKIIFGHWAAMLPILLVILLAAASSRSRPAWCSEASLLVKALLLFGIVVVPFVVLTGTSYALGGAVSAHVYDGFFFLIATAVAAFVAACGFDLGQRDDVRTFLGTQQGSLLRSGAMLAALLAVIFLPRFRAAFHDIDPAIRNRAVWVQRNANIWAQANAGIRDVVVRQQMVPLTILPFSGFDVAEDSKWYANQHLATYYGLHSIKLARAQAPQEATDLFDQPADETVDHAPSGLTEAPPVQCDLGVDSINGLAPEAAPTMVVDRLSVKGWTAISAKQGIAPEQVFLTLSSWNEKLYTKAHMSARSDVNAAFGQPGMHDTGFAATMDVSKLDGNYTLGIARVYQGKIDSCSQFHRVFLIERPTVK